MVPIQAMKISNQKVCPPRVAKNQLSIMGERRWLLATSLLPQPAVVIADGVDGSPDAYIFSYNDGNESVIPSGQCTGGTCTDEFTPDPAVSQYIVSVTARNVVGEGPPDTAGPFSK